MKHAQQRQPPKRPHKPSSQAIGARMIGREHWRKAASLERPKYRREQAGTFTGIMPGEGVILWASSIGSGR
jgi:hypothetical protein